MIEAFQHRNGGGRIVGIDSAIASDCLLDNSSFIEGETFVSGASSITNNSALKDSHVALGDIQKSILINSHVTGALVFASGLEDAVVRGLKDRPTVVQNSMLAGKVVIEGCTVRNVDITGPYLIHTDWNYTPRHYLLRPCEGVEMGISECRPGYAHCGCECRTIAKWVRKKETLRKIFVKRGWDPVSIDVIHQLFEEWRQRIRLVA